MAAEQPPAPYTPEELRELNRLPDPRIPRCEIIDITTREVWQDLNPTPLDWYEEVVLDPTLRKVGCGTASCDETWFRRSPDGEADGPVRTREIDGRPFFFCARPPSEIPQGDPRYMEVDKYHSACFKAGREVEILTIPVGREFVLFLGGEKDAPQPALPEGWLVRRLVLEKDWILHMPAPAETYWFDGMISYQGPVNAPDRESSIPK